MGLTNGVGKSCDSVSPWSVENNSFREVGLEVLVEMIAPGGVYLGKSLCVDPSVRQCLLFLWLSQGSELLLANRDTAFARSYKIDPRSFDQAVNRSRGMATAVWLECRRLDPRGSSGYSLQGES
jgi:hypothetical protein